MDYFVFAYGTLKDSNLRNELLLRDVPASKAKLTGFRIDQVLLDGTYYPIAHRDPFNKKEINGVVFKVNGREIKILDEYESDAYKRILITLQSGQDTWLYVNA